MSQVVTLTGYTPTPRFDSVPWTEARIEEGTTSDGPWTQIDVITLDPVDPDPSDPLERNFTTDEASDTIGLFYRIIFADAGGATLQPTVPVQNVAQTVRDSYADLDELFRILQIRTPSGDQEAAGARVLAAAADEIDAEIGGDDVPFTAPYPELVVQVNLDRAADLWRHTESIAGVTGLLGDEGGQITFGRYSWERYAARLAPLKVEWGLA